MPSLVFADEADLSGVAELAHCDGALLTVGTVLLIPCCGARNLAPTARVVEPPMGATHYSEDLPS